MGKDDMDSDANMYRTLDDFMASVCSKDSNVRLDVFVRLEDYIKNDKSNLNCSDLNTFCNSILLWISSSNFKISINGLTIIQLLVQRLTEQLKNHSTEIVTHVVDRLGDGKEQVRFASKNILIFMMACYTPNFIWEKLSIGFNHKLPKVKEETLALLIDTLIKFGSSNLHIGKLVTQIVKLLTDTNQLVRDKAFESLIETYKHVGDTLRNDLRKKQLPEEKLKLIFSKFDEVIKNGDLKEEVKKSSTSTTTTTTTTTSLNQTNNNQQQKSNKNSKADLADLSSASCTSLSASSSTVANNTTTTNNTNTSNKMIKPSTSSTTTGTATNSKLVPPRSISSLSSNTGRTGSTSTNTGGVDEDAFMTAFEKVPVVTVYSATDISQHVGQINECLSIPDNDWEKRVDSLKRLRSIVIACRGKEDPRFEEELVESIRKCSGAISLQIKDLRSQIVREACITLAYLSQSFGNRFEILIEQQMNSLFTLIQNCAKVMATSGLVALRFIIENTHASRLIPFVLNGIDSRSKEIRRASCEFLNQLLLTWDPIHFDKQVKLIQAAIKKGIADADPDARVYARKAFWSLNNLYPSLGDALLQTLDAKTKKLLQNGSQGAFGSVNSVKSLKDGGNNSNTLIQQQQQKQQSQEQQQQQQTINYDFMDSQNNRLNRMASNTQTAATPGSKIKRSTSAVDIKNPRSNSSINSSRIPMPGIVDSATTLRNPTSRIPTSTIPTPSKSGSRIVQSQPGSRSTSPTPKFSYLTHTNNLTGAINSVIIGGGGGGGSGHSPLLNNSNIINNSNNNDLVSTPNNYSHITSKINTGLSRSGGSTTSANKPKLQSSSRNSSRESSPGRRSNYGGERRTSLSKTPNRRLFGRTLSNNADGEQAIANGIISNKYGRGRRWDDSDEASETSSICSERSFSSSIGGTRVTEVRDMNDTITFLSSNQWSERRDGLVNLKNLMQTGRIFSRQELKRLCEIFSRLFGDPHVKVFSLFLDTLDVFIRLNKRDLKEWLYTLLTKLLTKLGSENLSSLYQKLCVCLEAVRSSFDLDLQFKILVQFIKENTNQSANLKVRVAVLKYLQDIICLMEPVDFHTSDDLKYAVCRIVSFTAEPKSQDIRRTASAVLVALFNLNTPEFSMLLAELPKNIQETASRILRSHIKNLTQENGGSSTITNTTSTSSSNYSPTSYVSDYNKYKVHTNFFNDYLNSNNNSSVVVNQTNNNTSINQNDSLLNSSSSQLSHVIKDIQNLNMNSNYHYLNHHNLNSKPNQGGLLNNKKLLDTLSKDSGVQSNGDVDSDSDGAMTTSSTTSSSASNLPNINYIITSLSSNNSSGSSSSNERLKSMKDLTELIKAGNRPECKWNENFKNILFCLFNHLDSASSNENSVDQALAVQTLIALRELLQFQYKEFSNYIELTIMKLIEKYKESPPNELSKLVEEVIYTAGRCLPPEPCARILKPLIETAEYPKNLIAIRMMQKTIEQMNQDMCQRLLQDVLNALLIAWDSPHSPVRKAAVFCLVSLYMNIGENLRAHLNNLSSSKMKLLNVYINRAKESKDNQI